MNTDIRLQMSFYSNTKVKKLQRLLGADAVLSLIYLWLYTAENRPHGELRGMDENDIAIAAQYNSDAVLFVSTLRELSFLDKKGKLHIIHDWESNNPWAASAPARSDSAKKAAKARWLKRQGKTVCDSHDSALRIDAERNAPSPIPLPSPLPSPSLKEKKKESLVQKPPKSRAPSGEVQIFLAWWSKVYGSFENQTYMISAKDAKNVADILKAVPLKETISRVIAFFTVADSFYEGKRDIPFFRSQINKIVMATDAEIDYFRESGLMPPKGVKFEDWKFWEVVNG